MSPPEPSIPPAPEHPDPHPDPIRPADLLRRAAERADWTERWHALVEARLWGPAGLGLVALVAAAGLGVGLYLLSNSPGRSGAGPASLPMAPGASTGGPAGTALGGETSSAPEGTSQSELVVQAAGAVNRPGVFHLGAGARVGDLVDRAGGLAGDADADRVDLAAPLTDGALVYIPRRGELGAPGPVVDGGAGGSTSAGDPAVPAPAAIVDLNSASATQLDSLPGIGPATAAAILAYRRQHGPFRSVDQLAEVDGIGPAKLAQLRAHVRI